MLGRKFSWFDEFEKVDRDGVDRPVRHFDHADHEVARTFLVFGVFGAKAMEETGADELAFSTVGERALRWWDTDVFINVNYAWKIGHKNRQTLPGLPAGGLTLSCADERTP